MTATLDTSGERAVVEVKGEPGLMTVEFDNGFWSKIGDEWKNQPKTNLPGATDSSHSLKFGKTILQWSQAVTRPVGLRIEIVPQTASAPREGSLLPVKVLFDGKPLAGAKIHLDGYDEVTAMSTDTSGTANIRVVKGTQLIGAEHQLPYSGPEAGKTTFAANLRFAAP